MLYKAGDVVRRPQYAYNALKSQLACSASLCQWENIAADHATSSLAVVLLVEAMGFDVFKF